MAGNDARQVLEEAIRERREDYASLSRMIGRNAAYIQQFIKRGVPRRLAEEDRRQLARYLSIPEEKLGGPAQAFSPRGVVADAPAVRRTDLVLVPRLETSASAGPGALAGDEAPVSSLGFDRTWLRELTHGSPAALSMIRVSGDSMAPTLADGDEILVDRGDAADGLRDGIYVLRIDDALIVKRLAVNPSAPSLAILSDNAAYPSWRDCDPAGVEVIGRVVWAGRRIV